MDSVFHVECVLLVTCMIMLCGSCSSSYDDIRRVQKIADLPDGKESFTVLNYNVLAQDLIDIHKYLYRDHEPKNLEWSQRKEVLRRQFLQADADILALQEVQEDHIPTFYQHLEDRGYKGRFKKRTNKNITDGCAVYYRTNKFDFIDVVEVEYNQPGISILDKPNVALIVRLKHKANNKELIIANTHLLYNPKRWDIRLAQIQVLLAEIHRIVSSTKSSPSILLVGDLNSQPGSPIVTLLESGSYEAERTVLPDHLGILPNCTHRGESKLYNSKLLLSVFDSDDETCEGPNDCSKAGSSLEEELESSRASSTSSPRENYLKSPPSNSISHGFNFSTTYESVNTANERKATTYQDKWVLVDYMFYSNLTLISRQRLPTVDECGTYIEYIPSETVGSDHLPLLATYAL